jgi:polyferredoxin
MQAGYISARLRIVWILLLLAFVPLGTPTLWAEDGFVSWEEVSASESANTLIIAKEEHSRGGLLFWKFGSIGLMVFFTLAGALVVRFPRLLRLRPLILLLSLSVVGFFLGGCPCPIKGVQIPFAWLGGAPRTHWLPLGMLLIILLSSYAFGPTFCGWSCPLGALQEFLFLKRNAAPPSKQVRQIMLWTRRGSSLLLALWLIFTGIIFWEEFDPFKAIFNIQVFNAVTWVLIGALLLSSIYLFRPFCRLLCPMGLINGLVGRLPGAPGPQVGTACNTCLRCTKACKMGALNDPSHIHRELCIGCGDCLPHCGKQTLHWGKKLSPRNDQDG